MKYDYLIKFPFSKKAKEHLDTQNISILDIDESILKKATTFLLKTISQEKEDKEKDWKSYMHVDDKTIANVFVKIYPASKILLSLVDSTPLNQAFAHYYMEQLLFFLRNSKKDYDFEDIITDLLDGKRYEIKEEKYVLPLIDVLSFDIGSEFKLQYQNLKDGNIFFEQADFFVFLGLILKKKILKTISTPTQLKDTKLPQEFYDYSKYVQEKLLVTATYTKTKYQTNNKEEFPPCFKKLFEEITFGHKLSHVGNFHLAVFLYNVGFTKEQMIDVFKNANNFDQKIASYQISKIAEKGYSVANCQTLASNGLCVKDCKVTHPLQLLKKPKKEKHERK